MSHTPDRAAQPAPSAEDGPLGGPARPVVAGIGASAGGIQALQAFFAALPADLGIAFVVVVHLSPEHRSALPAILGACTAMPVEAVTRTVALEGNRVYVIPPDRRLEITDRSIAAVPFDEPRGHRAPIDLFFRSLAEQHGDGFGIVLSGGGSDGAIGVRAIKEAGGLVLVQDPAEAAHDSMPRAAIATHVADLVLPVRGLAERLGELAQAKRRLQTTLGDPGAGTLDDDGEAALSQVLRYVYTRTGHDFAQYKRATVLRRVGRRMQVQRQEQLADYLAVLRGNPEEAHALFADLLISVTRFFRDPEAWDALAASVVPRLFDAVATGTGAEGAEGAEGKLRVWVPGCATGEEAYSVAILLLEEAQRRDVRREIQIFASDLDEGALATAREGRYPPTIAADVSEERLGRFFREDGERYAVTKEVRDCVIFTPHSLLRDPPFSRVDLVSCRNLLIYLDRDLQQQVFGVFRYALRPGRFLFVGASETAEGPHFRVVDKKHHLYQAREVTGDDAPRLPELLLASPRVRLPEPREAPSARPATAGATHRRLLEDLAPPSVLVDDDRQVVHLSETAGRFLEPPGGPMTRDLTRLVRPPLQGELRAALFRAFDQGESTLSPFVAVPLGGAPQRVAVLVRPRAAEGGERLALVVFVEGGPAGASAARAGAPGADDGAAADGGAFAAARHLEAELRQTQERLARAREESEANTEELRAANEELQSINEEYRSTAEELETSKEELQSINEELQTVNAELKLKFEEVSRAHSDLENLMAATEIGTLFLDRGLRIERFTPPIAGLFNVTAHDRGRPITDFTHRLAYPELRADAQEVLRSLRPVDREVRSDAGRWYLARLRPYRTVDDRIDGVVATFVDFTARRRAEDALRGSEERYRLLVEGVAEYAMILTDPAGRITTWNSGAAKIFGRADDETLGQPLAVLFTDADRAVGVPEQELATAARDGAASDDRWQQRKDGTHFLANGVTTALRDAGGAVRGFAKVLRDNTRRMEQAAERERLLAAAEEARAEAERQRGEALAASEAKTQFLATMSHELRTPLNAIAGHVQLLDMGVHGPLSELQRAALARVDRAQRLLLALITDVLNYARLDTGKLEYALAPVDLGGLMADVAALVEPQFAARRLALEVRPLAAPCAVLADADKLGQVLLNLLGNAAKFTPVGGRVAVDADGADASDGAPPGVARLRVRDTGIGIAPDKQASIFDPFVQIDRTLNRPSDGIGLGLTISRDLARGMGGDLTVESAPGEGSTFTLTLPTAT